MLHIPGYSVLGQIGRGGMATVYRARQTLLDREVALKVMSPQLAQDPVYAQRFLQEARMLAALNHPHVVPVYDVGVTPEGLHYFSMQLLTGGDFSARMRDGLSELELVRVLIAVAHALGFAHARGYVHRDVTPANILFDAHDTPVLTDFGIARAVSATSRITASGLSIGTSHYMSPEQARGAEVDHRSDIYSLGVLCFEALAGAPPFDGEDGFAVAFAHVHDPVPELPEDVARWQPLIDRAMAKEPSERFADCAAFIEGLREVVPDEMQALGPAISTASIRSVSPPPPSAPRARTRALQLPPRPPWPVLALGAAAGVLLGLAVWMAIAPDPAAEPAAPVPVAGAGEAPASDPAPRDTARPADDADGPASEVVATTDAAVPAPPAGDAGGEPHTVVDPVPALLGIARGHLRALRLTNPPHDNALERFRLVLRIEPGNAQAAAGIADVAQAYLDLAARANVDTDIDTWLNYVRLAERVGGEHPTAAAKREAAQSLRASFVAERIERGRAAVAAWDSDAAASAFEAALKADPDNADARRGLAEAARVGKPGYRFRDDAAAPELVVVSERLALGRTPVTVAQFRGWWDDAGRARFANALPPCRDRENTSVFHSTRGRGWTAPGFAQDDSHPVVCISPAMAEAYVSWLSQRSGQRYRLPTAAELEPYSATPAEPCQANTRDHAYRDAFGGRDHQPCSDGHAATAPVGSFAQVAPGLRDTRGNVRAWTADCSGPNCRERVAIGASWHSPPGEPMRDTFAADQASNTIGLRVAREIEPRARP